MPKTSVDVEPVVQQGAASPPCEPSLNKLRANADLEVIPVNLLLMNLL
jgi:hypothetical protein